MNVDNVVVTAHAAATVAMAGVIWFVQIAHYPLFLRVGEPGYAHYAAGHVRRTTTVVAPLMLTELAAAVWLLASPPTDAVLATRIGFGLLLVIWLSTAVQQVPCHRRLERGFDRAAIQQLIRTNWVRTAAWTGRAGIALHLLGSVVAAR